MSMLMLTLSVCDAGWMNKLGFICADSLRMLASISNALTLFACLRVELAEMAQGSFEFFLSKWYTLRFLESIVKYEICPCYDMCM